MPPLPPTPAAPLVDRYARTISYLRLSVIDRCDLRCTYCMPERQTFLPKADVLSLEELYRLSIGFMARGVRKIRLTGGEPLVRRDMVELVRALGRHIGHELDEVTLTTNGTHLSEHAETLAKAGIRRVNISLDTLDADLFSRITRRDALGSVMEGISAARAAGMAVKINTVALKGENEEEIPDLIAWAHAQGHEITLIEVMPLGTVDGDRFDQFVPLSKVRTGLERRWTLTPETHRSGGPAHYVRVEQTGGRLGFITPLTSNFCDGCNRIRVTATGQLFACLGGREQVDLRAALRGYRPDAALDEALNEAMRIKPEKHHFAIAHAGAEPALARHMSMTGG